MAAVAVNPHLGSGAGVHFNEDVAQSKEALEYIKGQLEEIRRQRRNHGEGGGGAAGGGGTAAGGAVGESPRGGASVDGSVMDGMPNYDMMHLNDLFTGACPIALDPRPCILDPRPWTLDPRP